MWKYRTRRSISRLGFTLWLIVVTIAIIFPVYWMFITSIKELGEIFSSKPSFIPLNIDWSAFAGAIREGKAIVWITNSTIVSLGVVSLNLFVATLAAYAVAKFRFRGHFTILFLVLVTQMIPPVLVIVPLYMIFNRVGLYDNLLALVLADTILTLPFSTWILFSFFEKIQKELLEAAIIDGCSHYMVFWHIAVPIIRPALLTVGLITFFDTWNEFLYALTFISSEGKWVGSVGLSSFIGEFVISWRSMLAHSVFFAAPPILLYLIFRRQIVEGIEAGLGK